jgi:single-strand DNA-binding protein
MEITGRVTADAEVRKATGNRELVAFTVVVNDHYKTKDGELKEFSEYFNCSYWLSAKIANSLQKGAIVTVSGRIYLNEYKGKDGNNHAQLALHASGIKIIAKGVKKQTAAEQPANASDTKEDLPF